MTILLERLLAYLSQNSDKFNCRWIVKRDPDLWKGIVYATSFLPEEALPKQRCWHVLHQCYMRPTCPVTGLEVNWFENRYLTYVDRSAKSRSTLVQEKMRATYIATHGVDFYTDPNVKLKKRATYQITRAEGRLKPRPPFSEAWHAKIQATWNKKVQALEDGGFYAYRRRANRITARNYRLHRDKIVGNHLVRSYTIHLDHIYSVYEGWRNDVDPEIVGHWTNLQLIESFKNKGKAARCDKTLEQLMADYERNSDL